VLFDKEILVVLTHNSFGVLVISRFDGLVASRSDVDYACLPAHVLWQLTSWGRGLTSAET
jgi:hypothetical protein